MLLKNIDLTIQIVNIEANDLFDKHLDWWE